MHSVDENAYGGVGGSADRSADGPDAADRQARESERMFRALFELASVAMAQADPRTCRFVSVNRKFCELVGYSREELVGSVISDITHVDDRPVDAIKFGQILVGALPKDSWEKRYVRKDGSVVWARVNMSAIRDQLGTPIRTVAVVEDINEHKRVEAALAASRGYLEAAFSNMTDAVFISNAQGRFVEFNDAFATFHRFKSRAECAVTLAEYPAFLDVIDARGDPVPLERWAVPSALRGEVVANRMYTLRRRDTGETWVGSYSYGPIRGMDGEITGSVVVARDVTEQKRALEAIHDSNRRYSDLFHNMNEGLAYCRMIYEGDRAADFEYLSVNESFEELTGLRNVVGKRFTELVPNVHRDDPEVFEVYGRVTRSGVAEKVERYNAALKKWFQLSIFSAGGGCFVALFDVITARKTAEAALRERTAFLEAQVESALDAILVVNEFEATILRNERLTEMFRFPPEVLSGTDSSRLHAFIAKQTRNPEQHLARVRHLYLDREEVGRDEITLADGRFLDRYSAPVRDKSGRYYGRIWTLRDVTERRRLEAQFLRAQRLEAVGTLSSGIAHDLNNILSPILMATGMIRDSLKEPSERELMQLIEASARRGAGIVRQLLTFSRGIEGERVPIQMRHLIKEMGEIARETFPRNIAVLESCACDLHPVLADATQLHQVIMNLCVNARDAMPGGGELRMAARNVRLEEGDSRLRSPAGPGAYVLVEVRDTGHGVPAEIRDRIFEPFFTTKDVGKGSGLGLSTALGIVRSHGGFLSVESEPGKGTTFNVFLPAAGAASEPVPGPQKDAAHRPANGETILVVDDEAPILVAVRHCLEGAGYRVLTAKDGKDAIATFVEHRREIRVVVTDTMMPVLDGSRLAVALQAIDPRVRVISSSGLESSPETGLVAQFLKKPYENAALLAAVSRQLEEYIP